MRVLAGAAVGLRMERDLAALLPLQCEDGGWEPSWVYKYGTSGIKIGNRGLTTALALNAITALHPHPRPPTESHVKENREGLGMGAAPPPQLQVTTALSGCPPVGLPSPPPSPEPQPPRKRARRERGFSASAIAKGVYTYLFPDSSPPLTQTCDV
jgi:hypothetical protein